MNVLSEALRMYCSVRRIGVRDLAKAWGCSPATVSRSLNGSHVDMRTFLSVLEWATEEMTYDTPNHVTQGGEK